jgi:DNA modification methylase
VIDLSKPFRAKVFRGDSAQVLKSIPDNSIDAICTDPPAGIVFMGKEWDKPDGVANYNVYGGSVGIESPRIGQHKGNRAEHLRARDQFISGITPVFAECLRVLKPGGHAIVWGIPRTVHWTTTALEDAGFEVREVISHMFLSGFPKSLSISKAIDKAAGAEREVVGDHPAPAGKMTGTYMAGNPETTYGWQGEAKITAPATDAAKQWDGWGTALKPSREDWILCRKPCSEKTVAANVQKYGTGALNIDGSRVGVETRTYKGSGKSDKVYTESRAGLLDGRGSDMEFSATGRWPPNTVFSHAIIPWYTLAATTPELMRDQIHSYYGIDEAMRALRHGVSGDSERAEKTEILLKGVRWSVKKSHKENRMGDDCLSPLRDTIPSDSRVGAERAPEVLLQTMSSKILDSAHTDREAPLGGIPGENARSEGESPIRIEPVEGGENYGHGGVRSYDCGPTDTGRSGVGGSYEPRKGIHSGTPNHDGEGVRAAPAPERGSASQKRGEGGQSAGKLGGSGPDGALEGSSSGGSGTSCVTPGELELEVAGYMLHPLLAPCFELSRTTGCIRTGTVVVKGDNRTPDYSPREPGFYNVGEVKSDGVPHGSLHGDQEVATWTCVEGCPVAELDAQSGARPGMSGGGATGDNKKSGNEAIPSFNRKSSAPFVRGDSGGASRMFPTFDWSAEQEDPVLGSAGLSELKAPFHYFAKPSTKEREAGCGELKSASGGSRGNTHPTLKSIALMKWLITLVTPPGGIVLDPFAGSGSTGCAAVLEGFRPVLIEREAEYVEIIKARLTYWSAKAKESENALMKVAK